MKWYIPISPEELRGVIWSAKLEEICKETGSSIVLEEDESSVQIKIVLQNRVWFRFKLRDRRYDGPGWQPTSLTDWTYGGPDDKFGMGSSAEESIYCLDPRFPLSEKFTESQARFIINPFEELPYEKPTKENLRDWLRRWKEVFASENLSFPGCFSLRNISGMRKYIHAKVTALLRNKGYEYLTTVPTWWHVAGICGYLGFKYQYENDRLAIDRLNKRLLSETPAQRVKSSWIVMLQFWIELVEKSGFTAEDFCLNQSLVFRDDDGKLITFPLSPQRNLWMLYKV